MPDTVPVGAVVVTSPLSVGRPGTSNSQVIDPEPASPNGSSIANVTGTAAGR